MKLVEIQQRELLHCFDNAWRLMMDLTKKEPQEISDRYRLVHTLKYRQVMKAQNITEYTPVEAMIKAAQSGNYGPWQ